jgi:hypothetical protein
MKLENMMYSVNLIPENPSDIELLRNLFLSLPECQRPVLDPYDPQPGVYLGTDEALQFYFG